MTKSLLRAVLILLFILGSAVAVSAYPTATIESLNIAPGSTSFSLALNIDTNASYPIDSAAFILSLQSGVSLTSVTFATLPKDWLDTKNIASNTFGATNYGSSGNSITSSQLFATLGFSLGSPAIAGGLYTIGFSFGELVPPSGSYPGATFTPGTVSVNAVPIPAAAWLLGSGLLGLVAIRRKFKK